MRAPSVDVAGYALSGGNQQKLIVGRELMAGARVLLANHPTRGVDVGAQAAVWDHLRDARKAGLATLLVSADLEELIGLSDRLLVMLRGRIVAELDPAKVTPEELGSVHDRRPEGRGGLMQRFTIPLLRLAAPVAAVLFALTVSGLVL